MFTYRHWKFWAFIGICRILLAGCLFAIPALRFYVFYLCPELQSAIDLAVRIPAAGWVPLVTSGAFYIPVAMITVVMDTLLFGYLVTLAVSVVKRRRLA